MEFELYKPYHARKKICKHSRSAREGIIFVVSMTDKLVRDANPNNFSRVQVARTIHRIIPRGILRTDVAIPRENGAHRAIKTFFVNYVGSIAHAVVKIAVASRH